jgi:hypothetical protein
VWLARLPSRSADGPHLCPVCGADSVHQVGWQEADRAHWWVRLRCGECGAWREGTFSDEALEGFERKLDEEAREMAAAADRLHWEWRSREADAFAAALDRDLIDAGDFA